MHTFPFISISQKKTVTCLPGLLAITLIMFCLIVFSFAILLCFLLQYSCTIVSFSLVGFSPFFVLWILLASQPRLARVSCFIRRAERTRSPVGIHGSKYRPIFSDNRHFLSFILARSLLIGCVLKLLYILEVTQNGGNANFELKGLCHEIFQNSNIENCHQI